MQEPREGYNTPIPAGITTPDTVETRIGTLDFTDGVPSAETAELLLDHLDFLRGVEVFLNCIPPASIEALYLGHLITPEERYKVAIARQ